MNCDPDALANAARCFNCLPDYILNGIRTYLLCQWENAGAGPVPPSQDFGVEWTPANIDLASLIGIQAPQNVSNAVGITSLTFGETSQPEGYYFYQCDDFLSLNFPNLTSIHQFAFVFISECSALTTISMPVIVVQNGSSWNLSANALNAATVNAILARWVASPGLNSGSLDMSGGTSAPPSGQGIADKATLIGQGVTVTTN